MSIRRIKIKFTIITAVDLRTALKPHKIFRSVPAYKKIK